MLQNSGPYGPSDTPVNVDTPVNMTSISSPVNLGQNLGNLGRSLDQSTQIAGQDYTLPNYSSYRPPPVNIPVQRSPFLNYQTDPAQSNFLSQNSSMIQNSSWQNGMYPSNMNTQTTFGPNMINYPVNYEKEAPNTAVNPEFHGKMICPKTMPLHIPQVPTKPFQNVNNDANYSLYNVNKDKFNNYNKTLDLRHQDTPLLDTSKKKCLENTVRLIEDLLENTAKKKELEKVVKGVKVNQSNENNQQSIDSEENKSDHDTSTTETVHSKNGLVQNQSESNPNPEHTEILITEKTSKYDEINVEAPLENRKESDNDVTFQNASVKVEFEELDPGVTVKVEQMNWTDLEFGNPFHRDPNGVTIEDLGDRVFIDAESSVEVANADIDSAITSNTYYECPHCNLCFDHPKRFLIHHKWHTFGRAINKRTEISMKKAIRYLQKKQAKEETKEKTKSKEEEPKEFPCKDCKKVYVSKSSLKNHRLKNHSNYTRECKICHVQIEGFMAMKVHLASHSKEKAPLFQCPECDKMFMHKSTLSKHRDTHLEKTIPCEQCKKLFGSVKQLKIHMKVHERVQRGPMYPCRYCTKSFYEAFTLQVHERVHTNEKPFTCDICHTSFAANSSLKRHLKVSHNKQKPFPCAHCGRCFVSASTREGHIVRVHTDPEQLKFVCHLCDSSRKTSTAEHRPPPRISNMNGPASLASTGAQQPFTRYLKPKDLQKHMNKVHPKKRRKAKNAAKVSDSE